MFHFANTAHLTAAINAYFEYIEGEYHLEDKPGKAAQDQPSLTIKVWDREPEPATFTGLALHLGFSSRQQFDDHTETGCFADILKWGRLRIEASYEKKLHNQSSTGAIFALKSMGWNERTENKPTEQVPKSLLVEVLQSGPQPASSEKEVIL